ncbi:MAG: hypothetical protein A3F82_08255 [Deltaproteobacteria bacterium RIFCSPLOWO2_12_FULL_44_12]|nr:MAG: hypothetical protein A2712_07020 [Deltaproteobacteria bacterium RIFCSPHIGHO2_01_FULL_43_49]OGQ15699.1 MAG: hypothetical protein A3D22_05810 [Deltaproteobacteria bacterium RIFCSPHIGHO2_02_FULL_44_53]OGQ28668.1 MAG: hypothetical protein A3D98_00545 [Deltaproteobacteria bacterium RIFCSPHIGHO2_12_FULL_44_21]OGQ31990.1 MAG: hypothetical protein A2979_02750 [Deltaproteobacteria bacterium RIFCSPLOWO2_01_FULL_45_74]OGQ43604.1 MAG: hypothetical protein A3I70_03270 [Deltaproteobacteria bacterium 
MPKARRRDLNTTAFNIVQQVTSGKPKEKEHRLVSIGRIGGLRGGIARKNALSPRKRRTIAKKAAKARWKKS